MVAGQGERVLLVVAGLVGREPNVDVATIKVRTRGRDATSLRMLAVSGTRGGWRGERGGRAGVGPFATGIALNRVVSPGMCDLEGFEGSLMRPWTALGTVQSRILGLVPVFRQASKRFRGRVSPIPVLPLASRPPVLPGPRGHYDAIREPLGGGSNPDPPHAWFRALVLNLTDTSGTEIVQSRVSDRPTRRRSFPIPDSWTGAPGRYGRELAQARRQCP